MLAPVGLLQEESEGIGNALAHTIITAKMDEIRQFQIIMIFVGRKATITVAKRIQIFIA